MPFTLQSFISDYKALFGSFIALDPQNNPEKGIIIPSYRSGKMSESEYKVLVKHVRNLDSNPSLLHLLAV